MKFSFVKNSKIFFAISIVAVVLSLVCFVVRDFNLDIEFVGGTELTFEVADETKIDEEQVKSAVSAIIGGKLSGVRTVNSNEFVIRTTLVDEEVDYAAVNDGIVAKLAELYPDAVAGEMDKRSVAFTYVEAEDAEKKIEEAFAEAYAQDESFLEFSVAASEEVENGYVVSYEVNTELNQLKARIAEAVVAIYPDAEQTGDATVSAEVSDSLKRTAVISAAVAIVLMLIYIAIRFEGRASIAAIICLAHDIIIMLLAYNIFRIPVSSTIIAAILTILGYSINATIVIFDRIRENRRNLSSTYTFEDAADSGIKSTIWRSLNTTITTLLTIGLIYFLGVTSIKNFALPLIVGIVAGVYSSVCLSGNIWVALKKIGKK